MKRIFGLVLLMFCFESNVFGQNKKLFVVVAPFTATSGYTQDEGNAIAELFSSLLVEEGYVEVFTRSHFDK